MPQDARPQLARLRRKSDATNAEKRRIVDLYQAALIDHEELLHRNKEVQHRMQNLDQQRHALFAQRKELAQKNALSKRITGFSEKVGSSIDNLDFDQQQKLLRRVVDKIRVRGWRVDISLRIPLDKAPDPPDPELSSIGRLCSVDRDHHGVVQKPVEQRRGLHGAAEHLAPFREAPVRHHDHRPLLVARRDQLEEQVGAAGLCVFSMTSHGRLWPSCRICPCQINVLPVKWTGTSLHAAPMQSAFAESFIGRLRDGCLNEHVFTTLAEARSLIEEWREDYNTTRPHTSSGGLTPTPSMPVGHFFTRLASLELRNGSAQQALTKPSEQETNVNRLY